MDGVLTVNCIGKKVQLGGARNAAGDERELSETARKVLVLNLTKDLYRRVCRQYAIRKSLIETRDVSLHDGVDDPDEEDGVDENMSDDEAADVNTSPLDTTEASAAHEQNESHMLSTSASPSDARMRKANATRSDK